MLFKNPKSEDKYPKVSTPKDVILDPSLNNYLQMMQDGLKMKIHSCKKTYLTPDDLCSFHREKMDHHLNSIRMWSSLESRCFSFWEGGIDTSISFDPARWCTSCLGSYFLITLYFKNLLHSLFIIPNQTPFLCIAFWLLSKHLSN